MLFSIALRYFNPLLNIGMADPKPFTFLNPGPLSFIPKSAAANGCTGPTAPAAASLTGKSKTGWSNGKRW